MVLPCSTGIAVSEELSRWLFVWFVPMLPWR
jgi:TRAP-type C4-dicarboxylate transport system permease small subunit